VRHRLIVGPVRAVLQLGVHDCLLWL
jgi:hypothetical protein